MADTIEFPVVPPVPLPDRQLVSADGHGQVRIEIPRVVMSRPEALAHAAHLVAVATDSGAEFLAYLDAARRSR